MSVLGDAISAGGSQVGSLAGKEGLVGVDLFFRSVGKVPKIVISEYYFGDYDAVSAGIDTLDIGYNVNTFAKIKNLFFDLTEHNI